ncbi:MAG: chromate transporter [Candidatus Fimadaptatus sp.]|nr:chromate transporter [Candidatus Fimadaptatus sp.]
MEKRKTGERNVLWTLFKSMLYISAFTFGGGFVIVTFMKKKFVDELHWINEDEMLDMTALAQSAPGAIAVNAAILVGRRVAGFTGMIVSVLGTIVPPITILAVISLFYKAFATNPWVAAVLGGMQAGVAAVICDVVWNLGAKVVKEKSAMSIAIMAGAFIATAFFKVNVIVIILCAAALGVIRLLVERGKAGGK